jgi:hypothetical protein
VNVGNGLISIPLRCCAKSSAPSVVITNVWDETAEDKTEASQRNAETEIRPLPEIALQFSDARAF